MASALQAKLQLYEIKLLNHLRKKIQADTTLESLMTLDQIESQLEEAGQQGLKQVISPSKNQNFNLENCSATHYANVSSSMYETSKDNTHQMYKQLNIRNLEMDRNISPPNLPPSTRQFRQMIPGRTQKKTSMDSPSVFRRQSQNKKELTPFVPNTQMKNLKDMNSTNYFQRNRVDLSPNQSVESQEDDKSLRLYQISSVSQGKHIAKYFDGSQINVDDASNRLDLESPLRKPVASPSKGESKTAMQSPIKPTGSTKKVIRIPFDQSLEIKKRHTEIPNASSKHDNRQPSALRHSLSIPDDEPQKEQQMKEPLSGQAVPTHLGNQSYYKENEEGAAQFAQIKEQQASVTSSPSQNARRKPINFDYFQTTKKNFNILNDSNLIPEDVLIHKETAPIEHLLSQPMEEIDQIIRATDMSSVQEQSSSRIPRTKKSQNFYDKKMSPDGGASSSKNSRSFNTLAKNQHVLEVKIKNKSPVKRNQDIDKYLQRPFQSRLRKGDSMDSDPSEDYPQRNQFDLLQMKNRGRASHLNLTKANDNTQHHSGIIGPIYSQKSPKSRRAKRTANRSKLISEEMKKLKNSKVLKSLKEYQHIKKSFKIFNSSKRDFSKQKLVPQTRIDAEKMLPLNQADNLPNIPGLTTELLQKASLEHTHRNLSSPPQLPEVRSPQQQTYDHSKMNIVSGSNTQSKFDTQNNLNTSRFNSPQITTKDGADKTKGPGKFFLSLDRFLKGGEHSQSMEKKQINETLSSILIGAFPIRKHTSRRFFKPGTHAQNQQQSQQLMIAPTTLGSVKKSGGGQNVATVAAVEDKRIAQGTQTTNNADRGGTGVTSAPNQSQMNFKKKEGRIQMPDIQTTDDHIGNSQQTWNYFGTHISPQYHLIHQDHLVVPKPESFTNTSRGFHKIQLKLSPKLPREQNRTKQLGNLEDDASLPSAVGLTRPQNSRVGKSDNDDEPLQSDPTIRVQQSKLEETTFGEDYEPVKQQADINQQSTIQLEKSDLEINKSSALTIGLTPFAHKKSSTSSQNAQVIIEKFQAVKAFEQYKKDRYLTESSQENSINIQEEGEHIDSLKTRVKQMITLSNQINTESSLMLKSPSYLDVGNPQPGTTTHKVKKNNMLSRFLSGDSSIDQQVAPNILSSNIEGEVFNYQQMLQEIYNLKSLQRNKKHIIHSGGPKGSNRGSNRASHNPSLESPERELSKVSLWEDLRNQLQGNKASKDPELGNLKKLLPEDKSHHFEEYIKTQSLVKKIQPLQSKDSTGALGKSLSGSLQSIMRANAAQNKRQQILKYGSNFPKKMVQKADSKKYQNLDLVDFGGEFSESQSQKRNPPEEERRKFFSKHSLQIRKHISKNSKYSHEDNDSQDNMGSKFVHGVIRQSSSLILNKVSTKESKLNKLAEGNDSQRTRKAIDLERHGRSHDAQPTYHRYVPLQPKHLPNYSFINFLPSAYNKGLPPNSLLGSQKNIRKRLRNISLDVKNLQAVTQTVTARPTLDMNLDTSNGILPDLNQKESEEATKKRSPPLLEKNATTNADSPSKASKESRPHVHSVEVTKSPRGRTRNKSPRVSQKNISAVKMSQVSPISSETMQNYFATKNQARYNNQGADAQNTPHTSKLSGSVALKVDSDRVLPSKMLKKFSLIPSGLDDIERSEQTSRNKSSALVTPMGHPQHKSSHIMIQEFNQESKKGKPKTKGKTRLVSLEGLKGLESQFNSFDKSLLSKDSSRKIPFQFNSQEDEPGKESKSFYVTTQYRQNFKQNDPNQETNVLPTTNNSQKQESSLNKTKRITKDSEGLVIQETELSARLVPPPRKSSRLNRDEVLHQFVEAPLDLEIKIEKIKKDRYRRSLKIEDQPRKERDFAPTINEVPKGDEQVRTIHEEQQNSQPRKSLERVPPLDQIKVPKKRNTLKQNTFSSREPTEHQNEIKMNRQQRNLQNLKIQRQLANLTKIRQAAGTNTSDMIADPGQYTFILNFIKRVDEGGERRRLKRRQSTDKDTSRQYQTPPSNREIDRMENTGHSKQTDGMKISIVAKSQLSHQKPRHESSKRHSSLKQTKFEDFQQLQSELRGFSNSGQKKGELSSVRKGNFEIDNRIQEADELVGSPSQPARETSKDEPLRQPQNHHTTRQSKLSHFSVPMGEDVRASLGERKDPNFDNLKYNTNYIGGAFEIGLQNQQESRISAREREIFLYQKDKFRSSSQNMVREANQSFLQLSRQGGNHDLASLGYQILSVSSKRKTSLSRKSRKKH